MVFLRISKQEHLRRIERVKGELARRRLDALYLTSPARISYLTGYPFLSGSRPFGLLIPRNDDLTIIIPKLEESHLRDRDPAGVSEIVAYWEYPGTPDPLDIIVRTFKRKKLQTKRVGVDSVTLPDVAGCRGGSIADKLPSAHLIPSRDIVDKMRLTKSEEELRLFKEAAKWGNLAHAFLQESIRPGLSEIEISAKATYCATTAMLKTLGPEYEPFGLVWYPAWARFKAGPRTAYTHGLLVNRRVERNDPVETAAEGMIGGYSNHLERTMYVGKPSGKFRKYFSVMRRMQDTAISFCRPGVKCSDVHKEALRVVKKAGLDASKMIHHRSGHGIGVEHFEAPYLVDGDETTLAPGMVFTVEPGLYLNGYSCFRHCDTVAVTEDGCEVMDYYPRELEDLMIA